MPLHITYGAIERALAAAYGIPDSDRETGFRGWVTNLQKLGVLGEAARVGRGAALNYTPDEWHRLLFALELSEVGVTPAVAVALIEVFWERQLKEIFRKAEKTVERDEPVDEDVIIILAGVSLRSGAWTSPKGSKFPGVPNVIDIRMKHLRHEAERWMRREYDVPGTPPARALMMNLSLRLRLFHQALIPLIRAEPDVLMTDDATTRLGQAVRKPPPVAAGGPPRGVSHEPPPRDFPATRC